MIALAAVAGLVVFGFSALAFAAGLVIGAKFAADLNLAFDGLVANPAPTPLDSAGARASGAGATR